MHLKEILKRSEKTQQCRNQFSVLHFNNVNNICFYQNERSCFKNRTSCSLENFVLENLFSMNLVLEYLFSMRAVNEIWQGFGPDWQVRAFAGGPPGPGQDSPARSPTNTQRSWVVLSVLDESALNRPRLSLLQHAGWIWTFSSHLGLSSCLCRFPLCLTSAHRHKEAFMFFCVCLSPYYGLAYIFHIIPVLSV